MKREQDPARLQLNAAVRALERMDRTAAIELLARFGAMTTPELRSDQYQTVLDAFAEALTKLDAST